jgi:hypothetical protein
MMNLQREGWARIRFPLLLLLAAAAWMAIQLVPLPPSMWQALPGRETIIAIDRLLGQPDIWRPISLTPAQTWNSVLAMAVPFAALLLASRMGVDDHPRMLFAIVIVAVVSALLGFVQILSGTGSAAYFYRITDPISMVGLFSNRNHHAFFMAIATVVAAVLLRDELMRKKERRLVRLSLAAAAVSFTIMTALIGSRAGFAAGVGAFCIGYVIVGLAWKASSGGQERGSARRGKAQPALPGRWKAIILFLPPLLLVALLGAVISLGSRATAFARFADRGVADDLRVQAWPTVQKMIETFWTVGSGFGSFPDVYKVYEPDALLQASYFNHAHNDWAELAMTGGLPFVIVVLLAIAWVGKAVSAKGFRNLVKGFRGDVRLLVVVTMGLLAAASLIDYPLRVPSIQVLAIFLIMTLVPSPSGKMPSRSNGHTSR